MKQLAAGFGDSRGMGWMSYRQTQKESETLKPLSLTLEEKDTEASRIPGNVLLGKFLATKSFSRAIISEIIEGEGAWRVWGWVKTQQI